MASKTLTNSERFTVVVPTKNRLDALGNTVKAILEQTAKPSRVIIIDQSDSEDGRIRIRRLFDQWPTPVPELVYVLDPKIDGLSNARNAGLARCKTPIVLYLDDDVVPVPDCLRLLVQALAANPSLAAVSGMVSNYSPPRPVTLMFDRLFHLGPFRDERQPVYWKATEYQPGTLVYTTKLSGACVAFRREFLVAAGGFDTRYRNSSVGEDIEFSLRLLRAGGRSHALALVGGALVRHDSLSNWRQYNRIANVEIISSHYWYKRVLPQTLANRLRFAWMVFGLVLHGLAAIALKGNTAPLASVRAALCSINSGYKDCPFLKPEPSGKPNSYSQGRSGVEASAGR